MDPRRERKLNCARSQPPLLSSFIGSRRAGNEDGRSGKKVGKGNGAAVTDGRPDVFAAVLNGRLEIKKLRINMNLGTRSGSPLPAGNECRI